MALNSWLSLLSEVSSSSKVSRSCVFQTWTYKTWSLMHFIPQTSHFPSTTFTSNKMRVVVGPLTLFFSAHFSFWGADVVGFVPQDTFRFKLAPFANWQSNEATNVFSLLLSLTLCIRYLFTNFLVVNRAWRYVFVFSRACISFSFKHVRVWTGLFRSARWQVL